MAKDSKPNLRADGVLLCLIDRTFILLSEDIHRNAHWYSISVQQELVDV